MPKPTFTPPTPVDTVETLTDEQKALMKPWAEWWMEMSTDTAVADRAVFEQAAKDLYRLHGFDWPEAGVIWTNSPQVGGFLAVALDGLMKVKDDLMTPQEVAEYVISGNYAPIRRYLVKADTQVVTGHLGGRTWAPWQARMSFFVEVLGLKLSKDLTARVDAFRRAEMNVWWWWPREDCVIAVEIPEAIHLEPTGADSAPRLHCADGPAIKFRDQNGIFVWHGVTVPDQWIMNKDQVDPVSVLQESQIERRRAGIEIIGWTKLMEKLNPIEIDRDPDPEIGTLLQADLPGAPGSRFLQVKCGTGRDFVLPVPQEMKTAREANAWTWNLKAEEYGPEIRT